MMLAGAVTEPGRDMKWKRIRVNRKRRDKEKDVTVTMNSIVKV